MPMAKAYSFSRGFLTHGPPETMRFISMYCNAQRENLPEKILPSLDGRVHWRSKHFAEIAPGKLFLNRSLILQTTEGWMGFPPPRKAFSRNITVFVSYVPLLSSNTVCGIHYNSTQRVPYMKKFVTIQSHTKKNGDSIICPPPPPPPEVIKKKSPVKARLVLLFIHSSRAFMCHLILTVYTLVISMPLLYHHSNRQQS